MSYSKYLRTYENCMRASNMDNDLTFFSWREIEIIVRLALEEVRKERDKAVKALQDEGYRDERVAELRKPLDSEFKTVVDIAKKNCREDLNKVMLAKRAQFEKCLDAPDEASVRLLNVLSMRSDLTAEEISYAAAKLNDNIQSLRLLGDIARRNNLDFPRRIGDIAEIEKQLDEAEAYGDKMIDNLDIESLYSSAAALEFYGYPGKLEGRVRYYSGVIDGVFGDSMNSFFTTAQAEQTEVSKNDSESNQKPNAVKVYLRGDESLSRIAAQFYTTTAAIKEANPEFDFNYSDLLRVKPGTAIIVPSGRMKLLDTPRCIVHEQVEPVYYAPLDQKDEHKTDLEADIFTD